MSETKARQQFRFMTTDELLSIPPRVSTWAVTEDGIECPSHGYFIAKHRLWNEYPGWSWETHMGGKEWCNFYDFWEALTEGRRYHHTHRPGKSVAARFAILKRDNYRCVLCGASAKDGATLEVDHIYPRSLGGNDLEENLQTLCWDCNRGKSNSLLT